MVDPDCLVICPGTIDDDSALLRHTIKQVRELRQIGKIVRLVDDEDREVERLDVYRVRHRWEIDAWLAKHGYFVSHPLAYLGIFGDGAYRAYSAL